MPRDVVRRPRAVPVASLLAIAVGAAAFGAVAIGALAIGRLAVGRLAIKKARFDKLEVGELTVGRLRVRESERPTSWPSRPGHFRVHRVRQLRYNRLMICRRRASAPRLCEL